MPTTDDLTADLSAFADDPDDVLVDSNGQFLVTCRGDVLGGRVYDDVETGASVVRLDSGDTLPYRQFILRTLGRLDVLAAKLAARGSAIPEFVDGPASLQSVEAGSIDGRSVALLEAQLRGAPSFITRVLFLTAEGGLGKTALLRHCQATHAEDFMGGRTGVLVWHVDLQGRQLVRLEEALMADLAALRVSGLWMPALLRLMRTRALVVAVDGFDELAAEQGAEDALGALAALVRQLDGAGTIIAASRRTFFDTEDYLRRAHLLRRRVAESCEFNELSLRPWRQPQAIEFLEKYRWEDTGFSEPGATYLEAVAALNGDGGHPVRSRPFLLSYLARALLRYDVRPGDFLGGEGGAHESVSSVVKEFVTREVGKWTSREAGTPYLTYEQHMELLAQVAEEMYRAQRDRLSVDALLTIAGILFDQWDIEPTQRPQIAEMLRAHVLLNVPPNGDAGSRAFDHPEFRDFFVAYSLRRRVDDLMQGHVPKTLASLLSVAQLTDSTAKYVSLMVDRSNNDRLRRMARLLTDLVNAELRPTYLNFNAATLIFNLVDGIGFRPPLDLDGQLVVSGAVMEGSEWSGIRLRNATAVNPSLVAVDWHDVQFENVVLGELTLDVHSRFTDVVFLGCQTDGLRVMDEGEEVSREYAPVRIGAALRERGIALDGVAADAHPKDDSTIQPEEAYTEKLTRRLLRLFYRTTVVHEDWIQGRFPQDARVVVEEIMPLLVKHGLAEAKQWRGAGSQQCWALRQPASRIIAADGESEQSEEAAFWRALKAM
jgi:hypothetical protein